MAEVWRVTHIEKGLGPQTGHYEGVGVSRLSYGLRTGSKL